MTPPLRRKRGPSKRAPSWERHVLEAIELLTAAGKPASAQAIAKRLGITRQCASRQLHALEAKGLVVDPLVTVRSGHWKLA